MKILSENRRYFYQLDEERIRYALAAFTQAIQNGKISVFIDRNVSITMAQIMQAFNEGINIVKI